MAATRLTDLQLVDEDFQSYIYQESTRKSALWRAGIIVPNTNLSSFLRGEGRSIALRHFNQLARTEANVSSDDPAVLATPGNVTTGKMNVFRQNRNYAWQSGDLNAQLNETDPLTAIGKLVGEYWAGQYDDMAKACLDGIIADNVANDSSDMVVDVAADPVTVTDANRLTVSTFTQARATLGDMGGKLGMVIMHSAVYWDLVEKEKITFIPDSETKGDIPFYMGVRVEVSDECPAVAGTNQIAYTSYLFGTGAVQFGTGAPKVPVESDRIILGGNGAGIETLVSRQEFCLHPVGFDFLDASVAGESATNAELALAANWNRVYNRKNCPLAILKTHI